MIAAVLAAVVAAVPNLDLMRYAGKWHGVARYPNRFQKSIGSPTITGQDGARSLR